MNNSGSRKEVDLGSIGLDLNSSYPLRGGRKQKKEALPQDPPVAVPESDHWASPEDIIRNISRRSNQVELNKQKPVPQIKPGPDINR